MAAQNCQVCEHILFESIWVPFSEKVILRNRLVIQRFSQGFSQCSFFKSWLDCFLLGFACWRLCMERSLTTTYSNMPARYGQNDVKNNLSYSLVTKHGKKLHYILQYVSYLYKSPNNYNNNSTITIFQHQQGIFSSQFHAYLFTTAELHTGLLDQIN